MKALLSQEVGDLCAWEKIPATEIGTLLILVEFYDATLDMTACEVFKAKSMQVSLQHLMCK